MTTKKLQDYIEAFIPDYTVNITPTDDAGWTVTYTTTGTHEWNSYNGHGEITTRETEDHITNKHTGITAGDLVRWLIDFHDKEVQADDYAMEIEMDADVEDVLMMRRSIEMADKNWFTRKWVHVLGCNELSGEEIVPTHRVIVEGNLGIPLFTVPGASINRHIGNLEGLALVTLNKDGKIIDYRTSEEVLAEYAN